MRGILTQIARNQGMEQMLNSIKIYQVFFLFFNIILLMFSSSVQAVPLSTLLTGDEIVVANLRFHNFRDFDSTATGGNTISVDSAGVEVKATIVGDKVGLKFSSSLFVAGVGVFLEDDGEQQTSIRYDVEVLCSQAIVGNLLYYLTSVNPFGGSSNIIQTLSEVGAPNSFSNSSVSAYRFDFNWSEKLEAQDVFDPRANISVLTLINLKNGAEVTEFAQTFTTICGNCSSITGVIYWVIVFVLIAITGYVLSVKRKGD